MRTGLIGPQRQAMISALQQTVLYVTEWIIVANNTVATRRILANISASSAKNCLSY